MRFLSVCSGIEAASVAWNHLGWKAVAFSEIEPFPCELLKQRYPDVPNLGDMNNFREWPHDLAPDLLCGGTPCQSYSNAGLRAGLDDPRGQLMLVFAAIAAKYRPRWLVWENVPGVLSSNEGRDFAELLGILTGQRVTPPKGGWQNTGVLAGIADAYGVAWRCFDAQYAGLAQRRDRVFLVGYLGDWRSAAAVLLERQSLLGHPAPSRRAPQDAAGGAEPRAATSGAGLGSADRAGIAGTLRATDGGADSDRAASGLLIPDVVGTLTASDGPNSHGHTGFAGNTPVDSGHLIPVQAFGGNNTAGPIELATALMAHDSFRGDFESDTFIAGPANTLTGGGRKEAGYSTDDMPLIPCATGDVTHALTAEGFDASEDGTGRGSPIVPVLGFNARQDPDAWKNRSGPLDTLGNTQAIAFQERGRKGGPSLDIGGDVAYALTAAGGEGGRAQERNVMTPTMAVRRFMPVECERLQGFPDGYTAVTYRRKPAKDGPRYKAIGNSWAIPCVRWIGERIEMVEAANRFRNALGGLTSLEM